MNMVRSLGCAGAFVLLTLGVGCLDLGDDREPSSEPCPTARSSPAPSSSASSSSPSSPSSSSSTAPASSDAGGRAVCAPGAACNGVTSCSDSCYPGNADGGCCAVSCTCGSDGSLRCSMDCY